MQVQVVYTCMVSNVPLHVSRVLNLAAVHVMFKLISGCGRAAILNSLITAPPLALSVSCTVVNTTHRASVMLQLLEISGSLPTTIPL